MRLLPSIFVVLLAVKRAVGPSTVRVEPLPISKRASMRDVPVTVSEPPFMMNSSREISL